MYVHLKKPKFNPEERSSQLLRDRSLIWPIVTLNFGPAARYRNRLLWVSRYSVDFSCFSYARGLFNLLCAGLIRCCDSNRFIFGRYIDTSHVPLKCVSQKGTIEEHICATQLKVTGSGRHTCPVCSVEWTKQHSDEASTSLCIQQSSMRSFSIRPNSTVCPRDSFNQNWTIQAMYV